MIPSSYPNGALTEPNRPSLRIRQRVVVPHDHGGEVPTVRLGPIIGLIIQVALLATLALTVGEDIAGWATGMVYALVMWAALTWGLIHAGVRAFGPADRVTLIRAVLVGCVSALTAESLRGPIPVGLYLAITTVALALDALDGHVARRTGSVSRLGAVFDQEIDAFLLLVLSVYVAEWLGAWVLAIGLMRYAFMVAGRLLPWLRGPLPPSFWGKTVAAIQGVVLLVAAADVLPRPLTVSVVVVALALLLQSFGQSVVFLWRHRCAATAPVQLARSHQPVG
jgi:phosphatidylglycerophosphate synthase